MKLTKRSVDALRPRAKLYWVDDHELRGFRIGVSPSGTKSFVVRIRRGGRANRQDTSLTVGAYGVLTVEQARNKAKELLSQAQLGQDVAAERRASRTAPTVGELAERFLEDRSGRIKDSTLSEYRRLIEVEVVPTFGNKLACELKPQQVSRWHSARRDTPVLANRALRLLRTLIRWAEERGEVPQGTAPLRGVAFYPEKAKERYLSRAEVARLGEALRLAETVGLAPAPKRAAYAARRAGRPQPMKLVPANRFAVAAIRFLLLSGWREKEALELRWDAIDYERGAAMLEETKSGQSWRPLGLVAIDLLKTLRGGDPEWVFPGQAEGRPIVEIKHVWYAVRHRAGLDDVRLHDLRHTFASNAVSGGLSLPMTGALLGHRDPATTRRYAHLAPDPISAAATDVAGAVAAQLNGTTAEPLVLARTQRTRGA